MKKWRFSCGCLLAGWFVGAIQAQPEREVRAAIDRLVEAENYWWQEFHEVIFDPAKRNVRPLPTGEGETAVNGYTAATFRRRHVVLRGQQATR